ncbi:HAMP domain-containing sensor histidine kinase [Spongiactinospora sp. TRM90649]|uniref:sensor histidine kinase n=1 Tax=Spongiactinospora sp. TRM90649 TaxID=3031114 RepID=UPI0023F71F41|nr:HAMP domain-containing sensor histidine kinase [Spongiactinospora sp. TRM90649]MDF5757527.1 HAMP domain-containing sensor histidine kinase [Spongiactinospora sp. TRM90649]
MIRATVRTRLTLAFGGLFLVTSTAVLVVAGLMVERAFDGSVNIWTGARQDGPMRFQEDPDALAPPGERKIKVDTGEDLVRAVRSDVVSSQWRITLISIVIMGVVAFALCWWLSGRALRPVHQITGTARRLSLSNLGERINMKGPRDELKELADTFDAMLERLARSADDQRRFVANASHELRTPLAVQRAVIEFGLADPSPERVAEMRAELLRNTERSERLIDGLLALAQGERALEDWEAVDLAAVVRRAAPAYEDSGVRLDLDLTPVVVDGDEVLLTRLVDNLLQNAVRYNLPGGRVEVRLTDEGLSVSNTGPKVDPDRVAELFQPFRRLHADRVGTGQGVGLGLSIVAAIARAHRAAITATANPEGGLTVRVALPPEGAA